jgi:hypothetical protein
MLFVCFEQGCVEELEATAGYVVIGTEVFLTVGRGELQIGQKRMIDCPSIVAFRCNNVVEFYKHMGCQPAPDLRSSLRGYTGTYHPRTAAHYQERRTPRIPCRLRGIRDRVQITVSARSEEWGQTDVESRSMGPWSGCGSSIRLSRKTGVASSTANREITRIRNEDFCDFRIKSHPNE